MSARPGVRALVLAAGRGERLRPLTATLPKPLLPVAGRPLVVHTLERLREAGCEAAALNLHHLGGAIRAALGASWRGLPLVYSEEPELLGTGGALVPLAEFLGAAETILVVNGDSLCRWPFEKLLSAHRAARSGATMLVHRGSDPRAHGGGVAIEDGRIVAFRPGSLVWRAAATKRVFAGATALAPELLARLPEGASDSITALYEPLLAEGGRIAAVETARPWHDLGTPARYLEGALEHARAGLPAGGSRIAAGASVAGGARVRRSMVEAGAKVDSEARIERSLLLAGARVGPGAVVSGSILGPGVEVGPGERIASALVVGGGDGERVVLPLE